jgi:hypothetical protein
MYHRAVAHVKSTGPEHNSKIQTALGATSPDTIQGSTRGYTTHWRGWYFESHF